MVGLTVTSWYDLQTVEVQLVSGDLRDRGLLHWRLVEEDIPQYHIDLEAAHGHWKGEGADLFEALVKVRLQLESVGWLIAVQGARLDTYPSGMARDMGGGEWVYVLDRGRDATLADRVDTLASAEVEKLATVADQERYFRDWWGMNRTG